MKEETLLFDPASNKFCLLNETAAIVWDRLVPPATFDQLVDAVCEAFDGADRDQATRDIRELLDRLAEQALIAAE